MPAPDFKTVYDLDLCEDAFVSILQSAVASLGATVYGKRCILPTTSTPYVEVVFTPQQYDDQREIIFPQYAGQEGSGNIQPRNTWGFDLEVTIATNRTVNGAAHRPLVSIARWQLQQFALKNSWTHEIAPYHALTFSQEQPATSEVFDSDNVDTTTLVFTGKVNIKKDAWPTNTNQ